MTDLKITKIEADEKKIVRYFTVEGDTTGILTGDTTYWYEASPVNDMVIRRCIFKNSNSDPRIDVVGEVEFTDKEKYYHRNILVEDCDFTDCINIAAIRHMDGFYFKNNKTKAGAYITHVECNNVDVDSNVMLKYGE